MQFEGKRVKSMINFLHRSNRSYLIIAVVVVIGIFLYFGGGARLGALTGGRGSSGGVMSFGGNSGFGAGWMPLAVALGIGVLLGWLIFRRH
jgi:hypothetical protein